MGRTACTDPQCLYKGALYLYLYLFYTAMLNTHSKFYTNRKQMSEFFVDDTPLCYRKPINPKTIQSNTTTVIIKTILF